MTITSEEIDGAEQTHKAAQMIAETLLEEAAEKWLVNDIGEAEVRERAIEQFEIHQTLQPVPAQQ